MMTVRALSRRPRSPEDASRRWSAAVRTLVFALCIASTSPLTAQTTLHEEWPQLNVYWKASNTYRFYLLTRVTMVPELGYSEAMIGFHADYLRLPHGFARIGVREISSLTDSSHHEQRALAEVTLATPDRGFELSNRTRVEVLWTHDVTTRLRERLRVEHGLMMPWKQRLTPFVMDEVYYDFALRDISTNRLEGGAGFDLSRYARLDASYLWERDWHTHVSEIDAIRMTLSFSY